MGKHARLLSKGERVNKNIGQRGNGVCVKGKNKDESADKERQKGECGNAREGRKRKGGREM